MAKVSYDWNRLDRDGLIALMWEIREKVLDKPLRITRFHNIVCNHAKRVLPIRSRKEWDPTIVNGQVFVGGCYYGDYDREKIKSIELCLAYNPLDKIIVLSRHKFLRFCRLFADTILHEIIHMRQYRRRRFKMIPGYHSTAEKSKQRKEQSYLGDTDEIGAYAFNIACELGDRYRGNTKKIIAHLNHTQKIKVKGKNSWSIYMKAFDYNHKHQIIKRLKKRVMFYVGREQFQKPFQSKDWISI